ncbi:alanine aminotransferase 2-like isoform X2 [Rhinatrema bivittatum]|uniref:alanine aminotransferase 2-like isoform X2 n=1 Tax=Rhinatrema bivittatum TaxID=194408 RepID=UPI0011270801|nr:alanine aminotransferase 2-like isoform X2 [Rhinatrema bivittatum]
MLSRKKVLSLESLNPRVKGIEIATLEHLTKRGEELEQDLEQGGQDRPFSEIVRCHRENLQGMGQKPITFIQQVAAACAYPELLNSASVAEDAKRRARGILQDLDGSSIGCYNLRYICSSIPQKVAKFIERRDGGIPSNPRNIIMFPEASLFIKNVLALVCTEEEALQTGVLVPVPHCPVYTEALVLVNAVKVPYQLDEANGWALRVAELRQAVQEGRKHCNPKVLCVINPGNPTGQLQSRKCLEDVIRFAAEENLLLFADEVQQENVFGAGCSFHSMKKVLFEMGPTYSATVQLVSCFSISQGFTGECELRAGCIEYVNIDPTVMDYILTTVTVSHSPILGQIAVDVLMAPPLPEDPSYRSFMEDQGMEPDVFFCYQLLEETGIILAPGSAFGQAEGTYHFRMTLLPPREKLKTIVESIKEFQKKFLQDYA